MKLLTLDIVGFGSLSDEHLTLFDGLNVLCRYNGWGKSTLAVFIKAMLYGLPVSRKTSLDENERKKYRPWQGGRYGGAMEFETSRGRFRVERFFGAKEAEDTVSLIDLATGKPTTVYRDLPLGVELFGIDEDGFERSVYLSQRILAPMKESGSIHAKLSDALENVEDLGDYDAAMEALEKRRKFYVLKGERGAVRDAEGSLAETERQLERSRASALALEERRREEKQLRGEIESLTSALELLEKQKAALAVRTARASLEKERNDRLAELARLTEEKNAAERFFANGMPTDEEIRAEVSRMDALGEESWRCNSLSVPFAGEEELRELLERFREGVPTEDSLSQLQALSEQLSLAEARRAALASTAHEAAGVHFSMGTPDDASLTAAERATGELESLNAERSRLETPTAAEKGTVPVLTLVGAMVAFVVGILLRGGAGMLPCLAVGGVLLLAGIGLLLRSVLVRRRRTEALAAWEKKYRAARETVVRFLLSFGFSAENPTRAMREVREALTQYRASKKNLERYDREIAATKERIDAFFARISPDELPLSDVRAAVERVSRRRERLTALRSEREEYLRRRRESVETRDRLRAEMGVFLSRYPDAKGESEKERLASVIRQREEYRRRCEELDGKTEALRRFVAEHLPPVKEEDVPLPSMAEMEEKSTEYRSLLAQKRAALEPLSDARRLLEQDTEALSELTARVEAQKQTLAEYKRNAKTIQSAEKLLTEAKEALSTRYLAGMQKSFAEAMRGLPEGTIPEARLNTSFDVLTRSFGEIHPEESLSRGLRDAVQFCVRLALAEQLFSEGETPFLILDDPFVNLDDDRLAAVRGMLSSLSSRYQILHLVCSEHRI